MFNFKCISILIIVSVILEPNRVHFKLISSRFPVCEENVLKFNSRCVKLVFCVYVYAMKDGIIRIVILTRSTLLVDVAKEIDLS